jgi:PDZ domain-containing secreted protein
MIHLDSRGIQDLSQLLPVHPAGSGFIGYDGAAGSGGGTGNGLMTAPNAGYRVAKK